MAAEQEEETHAEGETPSEKQEMELVVESEPVEDKAPVEEVVVDAAPVGPLSPISCAEGLMESTGGEGAGEDGGRATCGC